VFAFWAEDFLLRFCQQKKIVVCSAQCRPVPWTANCRSVYFCPPVSCGIEPCRMSARPILPVSCPKCKRFLQGEMKFLQKALFLLG
jgi:hypothetical protein